MLTYTFKKGTDSEVDLASFPMQGTSSFPFKVHVDSTSGLVGKPSLKNADSFDWRYLHGTTPDLRNRRYQSREITMKCWIEADSKQQLVLRYNAFIGYFTYDDLIFMKVTWSDDMDYGGSMPSPNPWAVKGLYFLVWLKSVKVDKQKVRKGKNYITFTMTFEDPYPMKRVYLYGGSELAGVNYDIVSETEIDIFTSEGGAIYDILNETGTIVCGNNTTILVCGDVVHAEDSNGGTALITPVDSHDTVTEIYSEI